MAAGMWPLEAAHEVQELGRLLAVRAGEDVAGPGVEHRMVDVHGRPGLALDGLGHEGGEAVVLERRLADQALEVEHVVGEPDRVAVAQVDLELPRAAFLGDAVDLDALDLGSIRRCRR
jgi:hypothetical protein